MTITYTWWKDATVYQIWPASYKDSNGDGLGDIPGIISTLDYLKDLGVDVVWLSPMYDSPQDDMGYDISDYQNVYSPYGTMEDMKELIEGAHSRGMKLILDLVINHTSSQHKWFLESKASKTNPKRDWYIWKPAKYDADGNRHPPNNWGSHFSGSAWTWDEETQEYYLHLFAESQPDLNWENEVTRNAIYDEALKFWFELGIDGFRIDTAVLYSKDQRFLDAPILLPDQPFQQPGSYSQNGPRIHEFHKEMFSKVTSKYDAMTVGEVATCSREAALEYVGASSGEMNMIFLFDVVDIGTIKNDRFRYGGWTLSNFKKAVESECAFIEGTDAWSTVFIENHDMPRSVTRFGSAKHLYKSAKLLAMLQSSLTGTLFIYQGQEIAMQNLPASWHVEEYKDILTINYYEEFKQIHAGEADYAEKEKVLFENIARTARDHARSPVQWDDTKNAGFSSAKPWTKVNDDYKTTNVASQLTDSNSVLNFWRKSLKLRKEYKDLLIYGSFKILDMEHPQLFTYIKYQQNENSKPQAYVVLNMSNDEIKFKKLVEGDFRLISTNVGDEERVDNILTPYEGRIYIVD